MVQVQKCEVLKVFVKDNGQKFLKKTLFFPHKYVSVSAILYKHFCKIHKKWKLGQILIYFFRAFLCVFS